MPGPKYPKELDAFFSFVVNVFENFYENEIQPVQENDYSKHSMGQSMNMTMTDGDLMDTSRPKILMKCLTKNSPFSNAKIADIFAYADANIDNFVHVKLENALIWLQNVSRDEKKRILNPQNLKVKFQVQTNFEKGPSQDYQPMHDKCKTLDMLAAEAIKLGIQLGSLMKIAGEAAKTTPPPTGGATSKTKQNKKQTYEYKNKLYEVCVGARNGRFIWVGNQKVYLPAK